MSSFFLNEGTNNRRSRTRTLPTLATHAITMAAKGGGQPALRSIPELEKAFNLISTELDGHRVVSSENLVLVYHICGCAVDEATLVAALTDVFPDYPGHITRVEFKQIMSDPKSDSFHARINYHMRHKKKASSRSQPLLKGTIAIHDHLFEKHTSQAKRTMAAFLDNHRVHVVLIVLIAFDIIAVLGEIMVSNLQCPCDGLTHHGDDHAADDHAVDGHVDDGHADDGHAHDDGHGRRSLSSSGHVCRGGFYLTTAQHTTELTLHWLSVSILGVFLLHVCCLIFLYRCRFWTFPAFVLELGITASALVLELHPSVTGQTASASLLAVVLLSRVGRVLHGALEAIETHHAAFKKAENHEFEDSVLGDLHTVEHAAEGVLIEALDPKETARAVAPYAEA